MIDKKCKIIISCLGFILVFIVLLSIIACEPETKIAFDNQRDQDITLFIANVQENGTIDKLTEYGTIPADTVNTLYVTFLGEKGQLLVKAEGDLSKALIEIKSGEETVIKTESANKFKAKYSIEYLKKMIAGGKLSDNVSIYFNTDYPLKVEYKVTDVLLLSFILAPRVDND